MRTERVRAWRQAFERAALFVAISGALLVLSAPGIARQELGTADAALTRLFTPLVAPPGQYVVYRSTRPIAEIADQLKARDPRPAPGAWEPSRPEAQGAFGQEGTYDRFKLARLFRGARVTLIRGSLVEDGQRVAYTLISPYPAPALDAIIPGTMVIRFAVPDISSTQGR